MMSLPKKLAVTLFLSVISLQVMADTVKTHVEIAVDASFKDKNIVFTVEPANQSPVTIGFYEAGDPLVIKTDISPIVDSQGYAQPQSIKAYVSDTNAREMTMYISNEPYLFSEDTLVGLSFPVMFIPLR